MIHESHNSEPRRRGSAPPGPWQTYCHRCWDERGKVEEPGRFVTRWLSDGGFAFDSNSGGALDYLPDSHPSMCRECAHAEVIRLQHAFEQAGICDVRLSTQDEDGVTVLYACDPQGWHLAPKPQDALHLPNDGGPTLAPQRKARYGRDRRRLAWYDEHCKHLSHQRDFIATYHCDQCWRRRRWLVPSATFATRWIDEGAVAWHCTEPGLFLCSECLYERFGHLAAGCDWDSEIMIFYIACDRETWQTTAERNEFFAWIHADGSMEAEGEGDSVWRRMLDQLAATLDLASCDAPDDDDEWEFTIAIRDDANAQQ